MKIRFVALFLLGIILRHVNAQNSANWNLDVASEERITATVLEIISGGKGQKRDWERFRNLFWISAQVNAIYYKGDSAKVAVNEIDDFIKLAGPNYEKVDFYESPIKLQINKFGHLAQVAQSYKAVMPDGKVNKGVNFYQLVFADGRWWIMSIIYDTVSPERPLPKALDE